MKCQLDTLDVYFSFRSYWTLIFTKMSILIEPHILQSNLYYVSSAGTRLYFGRTMTTFVPPPYPFKNMKSM